MGQGDPGSQHQGGVRPISCRYSIRPFGEIAGADVRQQALRCDRADCIVEDCEQAVRGLRKGILLQHVPVSARGILEPSRTVLDATATKWSLDVAQTTSRLDYQKMETMAESARRVGSLSPSLT